jgi:phosphoribosylamine--glycine ligase
VSLQIRKSSMKVLVIGSGGREHALAWAIAKDKRVKKLYCAPGNAGTISVGTNINIQVSDLDGLLQFTIDNKIDFTIVGPEAPLCAGIVDQFQEKGLRIFGPSQRAAEIEGSKVFSKNFMNRWGIPTAQGQTFNQIDQAAKYIDRLSFPIVLKADGLAAGKGVLILNDEVEAQKALNAIMIEREFGDSGNQVVVEEYLEGEEASILAITDGEHYHLLAPSQDHKRAWDGDKGPNTGGMGAYAPAPVVTDSLVRQIEQTILIPTLKGLRDEGRPYRGVLYIGLMITKNGLKVLEYNCRFGDPETQVQLPLVGDGFLSMLEMAVDGDITGIPKVKQPKRHAVCVVLASGGYPGHYEKGKAIRGIENIRDENILIFHAGTAIRDGKVVTSGGRVLNVVGLGDTLSEAYQRAYQGASAISFEGMYYRKDIAHRALQ